MGPAVAASANSLDEFLAGAEEIRSVSFEADHCPNIDRVRLTGADISRSDIWISHSESVELTSFTAKSRSGGIQRFSLDDVLDAIDEPNEIGNGTTEIPTWWTIHYAGIAFVIATRFVDRFIRQNGFRPVVDEVKRRRWVIVVTCAIVGLLYQTGTV